MAESDFKAFCVAVCVSADHKEDICAQMADAKKADLVEYRADLSKLPFEKAIKIFHAEGIKVLYTFRTRPEGGKGDEREYRKRVLSAIEAGADAVDLEIRRCAESPVILAEAKKRGVLTVGSAHFFSGMPDAAFLVRLYREMAALGCDVAKIAAMAQTPEDVETLRSASDRAGAFPKIVLAMGACGTITRITPEAFDGIMTFVSGKSASAPGQMDLKTFIRSRKTVKMKNKVEKNLEIL